MADIKKELNDIKNAVYGKEVRGSIHDGIKKINDEVKNATDLSENAKHQVENIQQQVNQLVVEGDSSVEAAQARVDAENNTFTTLKERLDTKETQFTTQLAQMTHQVNVNTERISQLQIEKVDQTYFEDSLKQIGNMTPKEAFATLQDLENAYPDGNEGIFLVQENGHWYFWNGTEWVDGGIYQALPWDEFTTEDGQEWVI